MALIKKGKKLPQDIVLLIVGILLFLLTLGGVIYFISFLSNNVFSALAPGQDSGAKIKFDLEGYKSLELE